MAKYEAKKRGPARFRVGGYSSVMKQTVWWNVTVTTTGVEAVREGDRRHVTIEWSRLLSMAMFYGHDYANGDRKEGREI